MLKNPGIIISKYFFLLLFLGFFGSITFFNHVHIIDGVTIAHSHPFKKDVHGLPLHSHSDKGYITIQFLSVIKVLLVFSYFTFKPIAPFLYEIAQYIIQGAATLRLYSLSLLRAPPAGMLK
jgi:hypothetical protein